MKLKDRFLVPQQTSNSLVVLELISTAGEMKLELLPRALLAGGGAGRNCPQIHILHAISQTLPQQKVK